MEAGKSTSGDKTSPQQAKQSAQTATDTFEWLESGTDPKVKAWVAAQNAATRALLDKVPERAVFRKIFKEFTDMDENGQFFSTKSRSSPTGHKYFQYRRKAGQDQAVLYTSNSIDSQQTVMMDPNEIGKDGKSSVGGIYLSRNTKLIAYTVTVGGSDRQEIRVRNVKTGVDLPDRIPPIRYPGVTWLKDNSGFYYTRWPDPNVPEDSGVAHVYLHKLGTDTKADAEIFGKGLPQENYTWINVTRDGKHMLINTRGKDDVQRIYHKDLRADSAPVEFIMDMPPKTDLSIVRIHGGRIYALTNVGAPKGRLVSFAFKNPAISGWETLIPEGNDLMQDATFVGNKAIGMRIVVERLRDVHSVMEFYGTDGKFQKEIKMPQLGTIGGISAERLSDEMFFSFTSFTTPSESYRFDLKTDTMTVIDRLKTGFNPDTVEVTQVWYPSKDGTKVPMFLVHKKGIRLDGNNPTLLYGYGGFRISMEPGYRMSLPKFVEDGGVYAVANLRGGGEFGEEWHLAGTREKKQNVFDDFIAAAEWLIGNKYTSPKKLAIEGGSNGGLLVAACMVQRPELFGAVVCEVPLTDMLKFHLFGGGKQWTREYGDPDDPKDREFIERYSPYHNVKQGQAYPPILIMSGDTDDRTDPLHARKMAAMLQSKAAPGSVVLLRMGTDAGHGGSARIDQALDEGADRLAFLYYFLDVKGTRAVKPRAEPMAMAVKDDKAA